MMTDLQDISVSINPCFDQVMFLIPLSIPCEQEAHIPVCNAHDQGEIVRIVTVPQGAQDFNGGSAEFEYITRQRYDHRGSLGIDVSKDPCRNYSYIMLA